MVVVRKLQPADKGDTSARKQHGRGRHRGPEPIGQFGRVPGDRCPATLERQAIIDPRRIDSFRPGFTLNEPGAFLRLVYQTGRKGQGRPFRAFHCQRLFRLQHGESFPDHLDQAQLPVLLPQGRKQPGVAAHTLFPDKKLAHLLAVEQRPVLPLPQQRHFDRPALQAVRHGGTFPTLGVLAAQDQCIVRSRLQDERHTASDSRVEQERPAGFERIRGNGIPGVPASGHDDASVRQTCGIGTRSSLPVQDGQRVESVRLRVVELHPEGLPDPEGLAAASAHQHFLRREDNTETEIVRVKRLHQVPRTIPVVLRRERGDKACRVPADDRQLSADERRHVPAPGHVQVRQTLHGHLDDLPRGPLSGRLRGAGRQKKGKENDAPAFHLRKDSYFPSLRLIQSQAGMHIRPVRTCWKGT